MSRSKRFYSHEEDTKAVAYVDILGFSELTKPVAGEQPRSASLFTFFENCILPYRERMLKPAAREVVSVAKDAAQKSADFWHEEVPIGAVNFVYLSDSAVFYSHSVTHLFEVLSWVFGSAISLSVPLRGAVTIGDLNHSEWIERPGSGICLIGDALTRAVKLEPSVTGAGMRIWLEESVFELARGIKDLSDLVIPAQNGLPAQLRWWLGAYNGDDCVESDELERQFARWFTVKQIRHWFTGPNCDNTKAIVANGIQELRALKR